MAVTPPKVGISKWARCVRRRRRVTGQSLQFGPEMFRALRRAVALHAFGVLEREREVGRGLCCDLTPVNAHIRSEVLQGDPPVPESHGEVRIDGQRLVI